MPLLRAALVLVALASLHACRCGSDEDKDQKARGVAAEQTAVDLYRDYSKLRGTDVLDTYAGGVVVTGTVSQVVELGEEGVQVWLTVDRGGVALAFADLGAELRQKGVRAGTELRARCQIGGKPDDVLFLTACVLR